MNTKIHREKFQTLSPSPTRASWYALSNLSLGNCTSLHFPIGFTSIHLFGSTAAAGHLWSSKCCHQCTNDTWSAPSFLPDPDTAAANLKQCLAETGFWNKASWLLLNLDKAEMMLISRGKLLWGPGEMCSCSICWGYMAGHSKRWWMQTLGQDSAFSKLTSIKFSK